MLRTILAILVALSGSVACLSQGFSDEFNGSLDARWEWVRPDPTRQLVLGSQLTIITQNGALYGTNFNNARNLLLQQAPAGSYAIETKVSFAADSTFHNAGVLYYIDDDNFVSVSKGWYLGQRVAMMTWEEDADYNIRTIPVEDHTNLYVRLTVRENIHFTGEFSMDGAAWHRIADPWTTYQVSTARIGLKAANGGGVNVTQRQLPARFDYFRINTTVPVPDIPLAADGKMRFDIAPAPALCGENVRLHIGNARRGALRIQVTDLLGRVVKSRNVDITGDGNAVLPLQTTSLPPSIYVVRITNEHESAVRLMNVVR